MLTALQLKNAKPGMHADGNGLYLQVSKSGSRSWIFRFQLNGRRREMGLGAVKSKTLVAARAEAAGLKQDVSDGIDPIQARLNRQQERQHSEKQLANKSITFEMVAREYIQSHEDGWKNSKHTQQWINTLRTYVYPKFGLVPVTDISTDQVLSVLQPIWSSKTETARRIRSRIELTLSFAKAKGLRSGENPALWRGHLDAILPKPSKMKTVQHQPALDYREIPDFMLSLSTVEGTGARALEFLILTATRSGEVRNALWSEIKMSDALWIIPADRIKGGREHRIPLSESAMAVLEGQPKIEGCALIFPSVRGDCSMSDMTMSSVIKRLNGNTSRFVDPVSNRPVVPHGFRSTFRDWAAEATSYPHEMAEMALAHSLGSKVEAAYRRGDMLDKRRQMMQDWAMHCCR